MNKFHIITPVKDSMDTTFRTLESLVQSSIPLMDNYTVYDDFSLEESKIKLQEAAKRMNFKLVHLDEITTHPSPNYLLVLQLAQQKAIADGAHLIIVESDVLVERDTIQQLIESSNSLNKPGLIAAVTTDSEQRINFPYLYAKKYKTGIFNTKKRLSFCCTLLSLDFLNSFDFKQLNPEKSWYDIFISHKAVELGFNNYLLTTLPVLHLPHSSRPWKLLKYTNPLKYYWRKLLNNKDKI